jgi:1,4-alpha-glucan branching enzyme
MNRSANGRRRLFARGELAIVLHSHMPYVEGYGTWPFGEEWLWEAVACVYLPLLDRIRDTHLTITLTPVLCDQLETLRGPAGERFVSFLRDTRARLHSEDAERYERTGEQALAREVRRAAGDYTRAERAFADIDRDLLGAFARLEPAAELWTSSATHAILPLLATRAGQDLQIAVGGSSHERRFGSWTGGFWLPECAYRVGLERELAAHGVRAFCVDQTDSLGLGSLDQLEPIRTEAGPFAIPIDWKIAQLVWDGPTGYPGAGLHRDYNNATGNALKLWSNDGRPYDNTAARALARQQGREFAANVAERLDGFRHERGRSGLVCFAVDTEIFGHWWYEGLDWLEAVLEEAPRRGVELVTLPAALEDRASIAKPLATSSWGTPKDLSTWDSTLVANLTEAALRAELLTVRAARGAQHGVASRAALECAVREMLALQASDWAFMRSRGRAGDYPDTRIAGHAAGHALALQALRDGEHLRAGPQVRNLAPTLDISPLLGAAEDTHDGPLARVGQAP